MTKCRVFVYGTLRKGYKLNHYMKEGKYLGLAKLSDYTMATSVNLLFPFIYRSSFQKVVGEVFEFEDRKILKTLDIVEGVKDGFFQRKFIKVKMDDDKSIQYVYCYIVEKSVVYTSDIPLNYIVSGNWDNICFVKTEDGLKCVEL